LGVKERKLRQKRLLRQEILDAASELFVKEGYLYFKDKAELLEQVCYEMFSRLSQHLRAILEQPGDPLERLRRGLIAYVHFGLDNPHHYRAAFMMPIPDGFEKEKYIQPDSPGLQAFDFLRRCVFDCISVGKMHCQDPELASQTLWCGVHGVTSLLITRTMFPWVDREQVIESVVDTIITGVSRGTA